MTEASSDRWWHRAACRGLDVDMFVFPERRATTATVAAARRVCAVCTVQAECLADALVSEPHYGVRAGTTPSQRKVLKRLHRFAT